MSFRLKGIIAIIAVTVITFATVACENQKVKLISWQNNEGANIKTDAEIDLDINFNDFDIKVPKEKILIFAGKTFNVEYKNTATLPYFDSDYDVYIYENIEEEYIFGINREQNEIVEYSYWPKNYIEPLNSHKLTREQCEQIAHEKLHEICETNHYVLSDVKEREIYGGTYVFNFVRMISNLKTLDNIYISINFYGEMFSIQRLMQNSLLGVTEVEYNADEVNSAINLKVKELYDKNEVQYEVDEQIIVKLKDGTVGLECTLTVDTESEYDDRIKLFVEL